MVTRRASTKTAKATTSSLPRSPGAFAAGQNTGRITRCGAVDAAPFDARKLPALDPTDFQWGTPTPAQQQQLFHQLSQMSFMYASTMHSMAGLASWPVMVPACPISPGCFHPGLFASCPTTGFMPMPTPMAASLLTGTQQMFQVPFMKSITPAQSAVPPAEKKASVASIGRSSSAVSDDTDCYSSGFAGTEVAQGAAAPVTMRPAVHVPPPPARTLGNAAAAATTTTAEVPSGVPFSTDELHVLLADDSFLLLEDMDTCSADEGSLIGGNGPSSDVCAVGSPHCSAAAAGHSAATAQVPSVGLSSVPHVNGGVFGTMEEDFEELDLSMGACGGPASSSPNLKKGQATEPSLRFPPTARGVRKPRRAARPSSSSAFAAIAAALAADGDDVCAQDTSRQAQVVPDHGASAAGTGASVRNAKPLSGSCATAAVNVPLESPIGLALPCMGIGLDSLPALPGLIEYDVGHSDEWDAVMSLDLDAELCLPFDAL